MKTLLVLCLLLVTHATLAQSQQPTRSFWVIEGNPQKQNFTVIRYYSADRKLLGEQVINKSWIDIRKKRNIRKLDRMLLAWEAQDSTVKVAVASKRKR